MTACVIAMYNIGSTVSDSTKKLKSNVSSNNSSPSVENGISNIPKKTNSDSAIVETNGGESSTTSNTEPFEKKSQAFSNKESSLHEHTENKKESKSWESASKARSSENQTNGNFKSSNTASIDKKELPSKNGATTQVTKPPLPLLKGTLTYSVDQSRHAIRGYWQYENTNGAPKQRFEYLRNLPDGEDVTKLPVDGEYHGSFNIVHVHTNAKGKRKERNAMILETGVGIKFIKKEEGLYDVKGKGRNDYGLFEIYGTATKVQYEMGDLSYDVILRKNYLSSVLPVVDGTKKKKKEKNLKRKHESLNGEKDNSLPPLPSKSIPKDVVCLKGKLSRESEDGGTQVVHRIKGMWSGGLDKLLDDPENLKGQCNPFDYEHRCSVPTDVFPLSGRYIGWFLLNKENGEKVTVQEKDVHLKFKKNSEGFYNIEGQGKNGFGKYNITGTLSKENELIIFRHFHPVRPKVRHHNSNKQPKFLSGGLAAPKLPVGGRTNPVNPALPQLKLNDVVAPDDSENPPAAMKPLDNGAFSVLSRGVLKIDPDGQHSCTGKWAISREQFEEKKGSNFMFGLKCNDAILAAKKMKGKVDDENEKEPVAELPASYNAVAPDLSSFPLDSELYYGHFRMKRHSTKFTTIRDQQIVLKFRKNSVGSYNVYGLGVNELGKFDLLGTFLPRGEGSGQIELYRIYHPLQPTGVSPPPISGKQLLTDRELSSAKKQPGGFPSLPKSVHKIPKASKNSKDSDTDTDEDSKLSKKPNHSFTGDPQMMNLKSNSILPKSNAFHVPNVSGSSISPILPTSLNSGLLQRSSSRQVKVPSRLEDDDPKALHAKIMDRCSQSLRYLLERDAFAFFTQPVDPLALEIPTYHQVITNPMDLGTISKKLQANEIESYSEFGKLVRLVFTNAMTFNEDVTHRVHQNAKDMLSIFNQKFKDVEKEGEKLDELLKKEKRNSKSDREAKRREKEASKEAKKKLREEQKLKRKKEKEEKTKMEKEGKGKAGAKRAKNDETSSGGEYVSRSEFNSVVDDLKSMKKMLELLVSQLASNGVKLEIPQEDEIEESVDDSVYKKERKTKSAPSRPTKSVKPKADVEQPLSREEQIELTETINDLPEDKLQGVMDILRDDMDVIGDDDEIDLEIDALKTSTQRKLQRYVRQKKAKPKAIKKPKNAPSQTTKKSDTNSSSKKKKIGNKDNSDDSDSENSHVKETKTETIIKMEEAVVEKEDVDVFKDNVDSDSDSEFDGNFNFDDFKSSNNDSEDSGNEGNDSDDGDDAYLKKARELAANEASRAQKRKIIDLKVQKDIELAKQKRLKQEAAQRNQLLEQRKEAEKKEALEQEEKKKEAEKARKQARDELLKQRDNTVQVCDLDEERKLMLDYEFNYGGGGSGSNSPGSDFGF